MTHSEVASRNKKVIELLKQGLSKQEVCDLLGIKLTVISSLANTNGFSIQKYKKDKLVKDCLDAVALHKSKGNNISIKNLAKELKVSVNRLYTLSYYDKSIRMVLKDIKTKEELGPGVYYLKNKITYKVYIGSSKAITRRINSHFTILSLDKHYNKYLQNDFNLYGIDSFETGVIEKISNRNDRLIAEQNEIAKLGEIAYNSSYANNSISELSRIERKMQLIVSNSKNKSRGVIQYDKSGKEICRFVSARDAALTLGFNQGNICSCCKGRLKTVSGFIFKYK